MIVRIEDLEYRRIPRRHDVGLTVPMTGKFSRLLHDKELWGQTRQRLEGYKDPKAVIPATRRFKGLPDFIEMSDEWCKRWVEVIQWASDNTITEDEAKQVWRLLIRQHTAFTDEHSPEAGYRDPITGENPGKPNIQWANLGMTGNIVKMTPDGRIEAFDMSLPPPPLADIIAQPWKWHWATEQRPDGVISNFWHIEDIIKSPIGVPVPLVSIGGYQTIELSYIERIGNGAKYNVYSNG